MNVFYIKNKLILLFFISLLFSGYGFYKNTEDENKIVIAFGSCSNQGLEQILWDDIIAEKPDLWIWLGDNIYGDTEDMGVLRNKYNQQKSHPLYQQLLKQTTVTGVWDDHDFGVNNGGKEYKMKAESQQALLDFLDVPEDDPRRSRKGVYNSFEIKKSGLKVKVILLDTRYFRDKARTFFNFLPNYKGTILGEEQWRWLEKELESSDADVHIIGNGIQIIPHRHKYEKWANFPNERKRLFNLIAKLNLKRPVFISGDRHFAELSKITWKGKSIYEITSSGLTHKSSLIKQPGNQYRLDSVVNLQNFGLLEISGKESVKIQGKVVTDSGKVRVQKYFDY